MYRVLSVDQDVMLFGFPAGPFPDAARKRQAIVSQIQKAAQLGQRLRF